MSAAMPAGPPARFLTGHLNDFSADPLGFLTRTAREYGDVVPYTFLGSHTYLVNSPELIESIRSQGFPVLIKPVSPPSLRVIMHNLLFEPDLVPEIS